MRRGLLVLLAALLLAPAAGADERLDSTVRHAGLWANTSSYTPPVYTSTGCRASFKTPNSALTRQLTAVAVPCYLQPSAGSDAEAVIHAGARTTELWGAKWTSTGWTARWGGSSPDSAFTVTPYGRQWPGGYGTQASGLAFDVITVADLQGGINHAVQISVPFSCRSFVWPATRTDATAKADGTYDCYRLGTVWKLPSSFVIPASWPLVLRRIAVAAQRYGMVATDSTAASVVLRMENYRRPWAWWAPSGAVSDPYGDPAGLNLLGCRSVGDWSCVLDNNNRGRLLLSSGFWRALQVVAPA